MAEIIQFDRKVVRRYGGCEFTLVFGEKNPELKDKVLGLLLENYQERISDELSAEYNNAVGERKVSLAAGIIPIPYFSHGTEKTLDIRDEV